MHITQSTHIQKIISSTKVLKAEAAMKNKCRYPFICITDKKGNKIIRKVKLQKVGALFLVKNITNNLSSSVTKYPLDIIITVFNGNNSFDVIVAN